MEKQEAQWKNLLLGCLVFVLFLSLAQALGNQWMIIISMGLYLCIIAYVAYNHASLILPVFLFFLPWSTIIKLSPGSISFCTLGFVLAFFCLMLKNERFQLNTNLFFLTVSLMGVTIVSKFLHGYSISASYIAFFLLMISIPSMICLGREKVRFDISICYFAVGIIAASIVSLFLENNANLTEYIKVFNYDFISVVRKCGFYGDPNFYSAQITTAIGGLLVLDLKRGKSNLREWMLIMVLFGLGIMSVSKSFILCTGLVVFLWLVIALKRKRNLQRIILFIILIVIALVGIAFSGVFDEFLADYIARFTTGSFTTGRTNLWRSYLSFLFSNPMDLLFGQGLTSVFNGVSHGSHNTIIQMVYQVGLIGCCLMIAWIIQYIKLFTKGSKLQKSNRGLLLALVVACFSMWMGLDELMFDDFFLILSLFAVGMRFLGKDIEDSHGVQKMLR